MSRLNEIIDNNQQLDDLLYIIRHYGVNAQFVAEALLKQFQERKGELEEGSAEHAFSQDLIEDLTQFVARF